MKYNNRKRLFICCCITRDPETADFYWILHQCCFTLAVDLMHIFLSFVYMFIASFVKHIICVDSCALIQSHTVYFSISTKLMTFSLFRSLFVHIFHVCTSKLIIIQFTVIWNSNTRTVQQKLSLIHYLCIQTKCSFPFDRTQKTDFYLEWHNFHLTEQFTK